MTWLLDYNSVTNLLTPGPWWEGRDRRDGKSRVRAIATQMPYNGTVTDIKQRVVLVARGRVRSMVTKAKGEEARFRPAVRSPSGFLMDLSYINTVKESFESGRWG